MLQFMILLCRMFELFYSQYKIEFDAMRNLEVIRNVTNNNEMN